MVDFVSHTWQIIQFKSFLVHIIRYSFHVSEREGGKAFDWVLIARMRPGRVRGGGIAASPLFQQTHVGKIPAKVKH